MPSVTQTGEIQEKHEWKFIHVLTLTELIFTNLTPARQHVVKNSCKEVYVYRKNCLVADAWSQTERRTDRETDVVSM
jgi:hypothetical protein